MMADLRVVVGTRPAAPACRRSISASVRPAPKAPILRKLRRLTPSQNRCRSPQKVNMDRTPLKMTRTRDTEPRTSKSRPERDPEDDGKRTPQGQARKIGQGGVSDGFR